MSKTHDVQGHMVHNEGQDTAYLNSLPPSSSPKWGSFWDKIKAATEHTPSPKTGILKTAK
jgi:hypothetical protein